MIAQACLASQLPPSAFLDDPGLGQALLAQLREQEEKQRSQGLLDRLNSKIGRR